MHYDRWLSAIDAWVGWKNSQPQPKRTWDNWRASKEEGLWESLEWLEKPWEETCRNLEQFDKPSPHYNQDSYGYMVCVATEVGHLDNDLEFAFWCDFFQLIRDQYRYAYQESVGIRVR